MNALQITLSIICGLTIILLAALIIRDRQPGKASLAALAVIEAGLVAELVVGLVRVFEDHQGVSVWTYVAYLVGALLIIPVGLVWSASERTRSGTAVLLVAVLLVPVLFVRLNDIWSTHV